MDLSRLELGTQEVNRLAQGCRGMENLQTLAFVCCSLRGEDMRTLCEGLVQLPRLRELELGRNRLLDFGVERLASVLPQLSSLEWLDQV